MWSVESVKKKRSDYERYSINYTAELIDKKYEDVKYLLLDMSTNSGVTENSLMNFVFSYNLTDQQTAELLDLVEIPNENFIQGIVRLLLGLITIFYCFPIWIVRIIADKYFDIDIKYKRSGACPLSVVLFETIVEVIFSTSFYYFIANVFYVRIIEKMSLS